VTVSLRSETLTPFELLPDCFGGLPCVRKFDSGATTPMEEDTKTRHVFLRSANATANATANDQPASLCSTWSDVPALDDTLVRAARVQDLLVLGPLLVRHSRRAYDDALTVDPSRRTTLEHFFAVPERA
jgi:hypothetical protein